MPSFLVVQSTPKNNRTPPGLSLHKNDIVTRYREPPPRIINFPPTMPSAMTTPTPPATPQEVPPWEFWRLWESVAVNLLGIPTEVTTYDLFCAFKKEGKISNIDIYEDRHGRRITRGRIRFKCVYKSGILSLFVQCMDQLIIL